MMAMARLAASSFVEPMKIEPPSSTPTGHLVSWVIRGPPRRRGARGGAGGGAPPPPRLRRADEDRAVVLDVDGALGLFDDRAHHLAAGADDDADLLARDQDAVHARDRK